MVGDMTTDVFSIMCITGYLFFFWPFNAGNILMTSCFGDKTVTINSKFLMPPPGIKLVTFRLRWATKTTSIDHIVVCFNILQPGETGTRSEGEVSVGPTQLAQQMQQMRELGLTDDVVNLQALQLTQGNLHAAVDLVFSGAISPP